MSLQRFLREGIRFEIRIQLDVAEPVLADEAALRVLEGRADLKPRLLVDVERQLADAVLLRLLIARALEDVADAVAGFRNPLLPAVLDVQRLVLAGCLPRG